MNELSNNKKKKKLSDEAKTGIILASTTALFFGALLVIGSLYSGDQPGDVGNVSVPVDPSTPNPGEPSGNTPVVEPYDPMKEQLEKPVKGDIEVARIFYDLSDSEEQRAQALVVSPEDENVYQKSYGMDFTNEESFDVYAAFTGKVSKVINDTIYGNVIYVEHESGVVSMYASVTDMKVNEGDEIKQGDLLAMSGESAYTKGLGQSLHFRLMNEDGEYVNPNKSFGSMVKDL